MKLKAGDGVGDGVCLFKAIGAAAQCALGMVCMGHIVYAGPLFKLLYRECNKIDV